MFSVDSYHKDKFQAILMHESSYPAWKHRQKQDIRAINLDNWRERGYHKRSYAFSTYYFSTKSD